MAKASPPLVAFNAGELSPRLDGRTDIDKYHKGCRRLENYIPLVQGGAQKRSGFRHVKPVAQIDRLKSYFDDFTLGSGGVNTLTKRTGYRFKPKVAISASLSTLSTTSQSAGNALLHIGFATGPASSFYVAAQHTDNEAASTASCIARNDGLIGTLLPTTGAHDGMEALQSFDSDGLTLIRRSDHTTKPRQLLWAYGGPALRNAKIIEFDTRTTSGMQQITGAGFKADTAVVIGSFATGINGAGVNQHGALTFGAAVDGAPIKQSMSACYSQFGADPLNTSRAYSLSNVWGDLTSALNATAAVASFDADGITLTYTGSSGVSRKAAVLLMETGGRFDVEDFLSLTSVTTSNVTLAGRPRSGILVSSSTATPDAAATGAELSIGGFDSELQQGATAFISEHGVGTSNVRRATRTADAYANLTTSALDGAFSVDQIQPSGFRINQSDADAAASAVWGLFALDDYGESSRVTMVPFVFNQDDAYTLEFGEQYMSAYRNNAPVYHPAVSISGATQANPVVITATAHGLVDGEEALIEVVQGMTQLNGRHFVVQAATANTFELKGINGTGFGAYASGGTVRKLFRIATPYDENDLDALQWRGQNDVLYIACPTKPPHKVSRFGELDWTIDEVDFDQFPFAPENLDDRSFVAASGEGTGTIMLTSNEGIFTADMVGSYFKLREIVEAYNPEWKTLTDLNGNAYTAFSNGGAGGGSWLVGDRLHFEGRVYECARTGGATATTGSVPPTHDQGFASDGSDTDWEFINYGYGYARIDSIEDEFRASATVVVRFPRSTVSVDKSVASMSTANPIVVTMSAPHVWETGDEVFFREITGTFGDLVNNTLQPITRTGASTFTIPLSGAGLAGGVGIAVRMTAGANLNDSVSIYPSLFRWAHGAWSEWRGYPKTVLFYEDRLYWAATRSDPQGVWPSRVGRYEDHATFDEVDAAFPFVLSAADPIEWIEDQNTLVIGTGGGEHSPPRDAAEPLSADNVNTIRRRSQYGSRRGVRPVAVENVLLFAQKAGRKLRELVFDEAQGGLIAPDMTRLADHITLGLLKGFAFQSEPNRILWTWLQSGELLGFTYERDEQVTGWHRHPIGGTDAQVASASVIPHPDGDGDQLWAVISRTIDGATRLYVEYLEKEWVRGVELEDAFCVDSGLTYDGSAATVISGLYHLRGQTVRALADGVDAGSLTVSASGSITLASAASKVQVGLPYSAVLAPMRIEAGAQDGTSQGKTKRVIHLKVRLDQTGRGLFLGEQPEDAAEEIVLPDGELFDGDTELRPFPGGYDSDGHMALVHSGPTPCTITAILPKVGTEE